MGPTGTRNVGFTGLLAGELVTDEPFQGPLAVLAMDLTHTEACLADRMHNRVTWSTQANGSSRRRPSRTAAGMCQRLIRRS